MLTPPGAPNCRCWFPPPPRCVVCGADASTVAATSVQVRDNNLYVVTCGSRYCEHRAAKGDRLRIRDVRGGFEYELTVSELEPIGTTTIELPAQERRFFERELAKHKAETDAMFRAAIVVKT